MFLNCVEEINYNSCAFQLYCIYFLFNIFFSQHSEGAASNFLLYLTNYKNWFWVLLLDLINFFRSYLWRFLKKKKKEIVCVFRVFLISFYLQEKNGREQNILNNAFRAAWKIGSTPRPRKKNMSNEMKEIISQRHSFPKFSW